MSWAAAQRSGIITTTRSVPVVVVPPTAPLLADGQAYANLQRGMFIHFNMATFHGADFVSEYADEDTFAPTGLDVGQWIDAAVEMGATYAHLTIKHQDGFCLWPTSTTTHGVSSSSWYTSNGFPDIVQMFVAACRARGVLPCFYFSIADLNWQHTHPAAGFKTFTEAQITEVCQRYGPVAAIWLDSTEWYLGSAAPWASAAERAAFLHSVPNGGQMGLIIVNNSHTYNLTDSDVVEYEGQGVPGANTMQSESCYTIVDRWFWDNDNQAFQYTVSTTSNQITYANARNAAILLNLPPNTAGVIPDQFIEQMRKVRKLRGELPRVSPNNMTSNTAPSPYVASASSEFPGQGAYRSFNSTANSFWSSNAALPQWIQIDLGSSQAASNYMMQCRASSTHEWTAWTLEGSNNGSTWTAVDSRTKALGSAGEAYFYAMASPGTYRYWRWTVTASKTGTNADAANLALFP